ncbi:MAG: response regulator [Kiloniellales bacterium]
MTNQPVRVLHVEDNPGDARLLRELLNGHSGSPFDLTHRVRLQDALALLDEEAFDVIVLDLGLPDSQGMATLDQTKQTIPHRAIPIVVVTGLDDEHVGLLALQHGAQDYLVKENLHADILARALRYAVERQRLLESLEEERTKRRQATEFASLEKIASPGTSLITAGAYGQERLQDASPDTFELLVEQYGSLIDQTLEAEAANADRRVSQGLRVLAQRLGFLRAGPRDMVEIHSMAIKRVAGSIEHRPAYVVVEEARMLFIEMMGYLAAYYRDHMVPSVRRPPDQQSDLNDQ